MIVSILSWGRPLIPLFFFQAEDGIRDHCVTGVQTCALPISCGHGGVGRDLHGAFGQRGHPEPDADAGSCRARSGVVAGRSEERRVGKEWRSRWSPCHRKRKPKKTTGRNRKIGVTMHGALKTV